MTRQNYETKYWRKIGLLGLLLILLGTVSGLEFEIAEIGNTTIHLYNDDGGEELIINGQEFSLPGDAIITGAKLWIREFYNVSSPPFNSLMVVGIIENTSAPYNPTFLTLNITPFLDLSLGWNEFTFDTPIEVSAGETVMLYVGGNLTSEFGEVTQVGGTVNLSTQPNAINCVFEEEPPFSCAEKTGALSSIIIYSTLTYLEEYTPTHGIASITGLVIDFGVELGVQFIAFASLIVVIAGGVFIIKYFRIR